MRLVPLLLGIFLSLGLFSLSAATVNDAMAAYLVFGYSKIMLPWVIPEPSYSPPNISSYWVGEYRNRELLKRLNGQFYYDWRHPSNLANNVLIIDSPDELQWRWTFLGATSSNQSIPVPNKRHPTVLATIANTSSGCHLTLIPLENPHWHCGMWGEYFPTPSIRSYKQICSPQSVEDATEVVQRHNFSKIEWEVWKSKRSGVLISLQSRSSISRPVGNVEESFVMNFTRAAPPIGIVAFKPPTHCN